MGFIKKPILGGFLTHKGEQSSKRLMGFLSFLAAVLCFFVAASLMFYILQLPPSETSWEWMFVWILRFFEGFLWYSGACFGITAIEKFSPNRDGDSSTVVTKTEITETNKTSDQQQ